MYVHRRDKRSRRLPATEIARELVRLGPDTTVLGYEFRQIQTDTTDDLPIFGEPSPQPGSVGDDMAGWGGQMSVDRQRAHGPYTAEDLHDLPDEGKGFELVDGWLSELSPGVPHNVVVRALTRLLDQAAADGDSGLYVNSEADINTPDGVRRPDVIIMHGEDVLDAAQLGRSTLHAHDVLLVAEVVSRGSASEREDRVRKMTDYARSGIPQYWVVDFDPTAKIQVFILDGDIYRLDRTVTAGGTLSVTEPLKVSFDPIILTPWRSGGSAQ